MKMGGVCVKFFLVWREKVEETESFSLYGGKKSRRFGVLWYEGGELEYKIGVIGRMCVIM